jgi:hypothetical protein
MTINLYLSKVAEMKTYLTPNEKWHLFKGILIGICLGFIFSIGIILVAV